MRLSIVVLEDNDERIAAMRDCLADKFPSFYQQIFRTSQQAIAWLRPHLNEAICISLDHDLEPAYPGASDPGTGRDVADFLARQTPQCPVIIHSTNAPAAFGMDQVLCDGGWTTARVMPYDDLRWIGEAWRPLVRRLIVDATIPCNMARQSIG